MQSYLPRFIRPALPAAILCLATSACSTTSRTASDGTAAPAPPTSTAVLVQPGAPGTATLRVTDVPDGTPPSVHTAADVAFMQGMIAHHAQAIVMTDMVPERAATDRMHLLAQRIATSQNSEIRMMQDWLRRRGEEVPDAGAAHHHAMGHGGGMLMPGMLTPEQLEEMREATGPDFERLFLAYMIRHHEGALVMVDDLFASDGAAQDAVIYKFASDVVADQQMEISRMQAMLDAMESPNTQND